MKRPFAAKRFSAAYSLVEMMIAAAVLAIATGGIYAAFLQANNVAASARSLTAARFILQRAADQALTATWDFNDVPAPKGHLPEVFDSTTDPNVLTKPIPFLGGGGVDPITGQPNNNVALLADPHDPENKTIIAGQIFRQISFSDATSNANTLIRITFTLRYTVNGVPKPDQTLTVIRAQG